MTQSVYASFPDPSLAERAAAALLDNGALNEDISLVSRNYRPPAETTAGQPVTPPTPPISRVDQIASTGVTPINDPLDTTPPAPAPLNADAPPVTYTRQTEVTRTVAPTLNADVDPDTDVDTDAEVDRRGYDAQSVEEPLSVTTPGDAGVGAAKGAGWGLGLGILAGLGAIAIPGFGLVVGGGALATAIGAMAATTAAGAIAGGVYGYLKDEGVPDHVAQDLDKAYKQGNVILAVHVPTGDLDEVEVRKLMSKYGAQNMTHTGEETEARAA